MGKGNMLLPALGIGAMAAPFMFPALGAGMAGAGVAAGTGSTAAQMAAGLSLPSVMGPAAAGVPAGLAGMSLGPAAALGVGFNPASAAAGSFGLSGLKGGFNALQNADFGGLSKLPNLQSIGGQAQQSQPPIGAIAPPPRPQVQPGPGLHDAATQNLGGQYASAPPGTVDQMDLNMISYVSQLLKQAQGGGPQFGSGTRTQSPAAGYA